MKLNKVWVSLPIFCALALPLGAQSRNELKLGNATAEFGTAASVPLTLSSTDEVQGLVSAFDWEGGTGEALVPGAAIASADTVVTRVEPTYMVLGVVMDSDGRDNEIILPGVDLALATAQIRCGTGPAASTSPVVFRDSTYATVNGGPVLDNIVVVGGLSIGQVEGLILTNGSFACTPTPPRFSIGRPNGQNPGTDGSANRCAAADVMMRNLDPVEGYVVALCHDPAKLELQEIALGNAATAAEFSAADISANGGTFGVVMDFEAPFEQDAKAIPAGDARHIARYNYCCLSLPAQGVDATPLIFCDNVLGSPLKENVIVVGGLSISKTEGLALENGTFECRAISVAPPPENCNNGIDDDQDGFIDAEDPDCQQSFRCVSGEGSVGGTVRVDLQLKTVEDGAAGHAQFDHVQGFSMAIEHCCSLTLADESLDISGTILEAIGAEFVSVQADATKSDGDGCEIIVGVLVDALPPFDGATIPPLPDFQRMGTLTFAIADDDGLCGTTCPIVFKDGLNGSGKVPVKNLIAVENVSRSVVLNPCEVKIVGPERFFRGDCNFSRMGGMSVDISDAAAVVSFLFLPGSWKFHPPCLDACDCNDDGRVDLADAICVLQYYLQGGAFPPAPGPGLAMTDDGGVTETPAGEDPTADKLDCIGGRSCD
jgi:hypothetical protein